MPTQAEKADVSTPCMRGREPSSSRTHGTPVRRASSRVWGFRARKVQRRVGGRAGRRDGKVSRDEALEHCSAIVAAVDVLVSADLENGFGDSPGHVAETIRLAAQAGLAGGSIEDATGDASNRPLYAFGEAVERVAAAVDAARSLPFRFSVSARCENFLRGNPNLEDTIARLRAFEEAGADVLFAPGLPDLASVRLVCSALKKR